MRMGQQLRSVLVSLLGVVLCLAPGPLGAASLDDPFVSSERQWVVTDEKFELSLKRFRLYKRQSRPLPVILIHGLLVNSSFLDFGRASLAEYLAEAGFDVWNLSLRGTGRSLNPLGWGKKPWNLDDILKSDLPAVIEHVRKEAGGTEVLVVGYELGGALALAHVGRSSGHGVAGVVSIAAPMSFDSPDQDWLDTLLKLDRVPLLRTTLLHMNSSGLNRLLFFMPWFEDAFYNRKNMAQSVRQEFLDTALTPVNPGVLDQIVTTVERDEFVSADGKTSYRGMLSGIVIPVLLVGGGADFIAPPEALKQVYRELGSEDRDLMIFWPDPGEDVSYGHFDLILGRKAKDEVFPLIRRWLETKAGGPDFLSVPR